MEYFAYNELFFKDDTNKIKYQIVSVYDNIIVLKDELNMFGIANIDGSITIKPSFYSISLVGEYFVVSNEFGFGLLDKYGNLIVKPQYLEIREFKNECAIVRKKNNLFGVIDINGKEIIKTVFDYIDRDNISFRVYKNNKQVIYDNKGNIIIDNEGYNYYFLTNGLYKFKTSKSDLYGIISKDGILINPKYKKIECLNKDRFLVHKKKFGKYIIDSHDNKILKIPYEYSIIYKDSDVIVNCECSSYTGRCYDLIINGGNELKKLDRDIFEIGNFDYGYAICYLYNGNYKLIDNKGNYIFNETFDHLKYDYNRKCLYAKQGFEEYYIFDDFKKVPINEFEEKANKRLSWIDCNKYFNVERICGSIFIANSKDKTYFMNKDTIIAEFDGVFRLLENKNNFVLITTTFNSNNYYMLCDLSGNVIIPLVKSKIIILSNDRVIIDNHIVDLNCEYNKFIYLYKVDVLEYDNLVTYSFDNIEEFKKYIDKINRWRVENNKKIRKLEMQIDELRHVNYNEYLIKEEQNKMIKSLERWL